MIEAVTTRHCSVCETELWGGRKDAYCPLCSAHVREAEYKALVEKLLPYARLYNPPEDSPDFDRDTKAVQRIINRAEKALCGIEDKWDGSKWVKK